MLQINCPAPCAAEDTAAIEDFKTTLAERGIPVNTSSPVNILVARYGTAMASSIYSDAARSLVPERPQPTCPTRCKPEGYAILPDGKGLALTGATDAGVFYALQTVKQMITGYGANAVLHQATIRDWPAMKYRGLDDDLSRGPVTTLEFEKKLIRTLAAYKINLYSPYFEHTAAVRLQPADRPARRSHHRRRRRRAGRLRAPLPHHHRPRAGSLRPPPQRPAMGAVPALAETPHGAVLAPGQPGSIALIKQEFTELAAEYPGPFLHIGADETVDLGVGQTKADVDARGLGAVYLDFMQQIATALKPLNRRLLFWGDIAQDSPELLKTTPAVLQGPDHRRRLDLRTPNPQGLRPLPHPLRQRRLRDLGRPLASTTSASSTPTTTSASTTFSSSPATARSSAPPASSTPSGTTTAKASSTRTGTAFSSAPPAAWQTGESIPIEMPSSRATPRSSTATPPAPSTRPSSRSWPPTRSCATTPR